MRGSEANKRRPAVFDSKAQAEQVRSVSHGEPIAEEIVRTLRGAVAKAELAPEYAA